MSKSNLVYLPVQPDMEQVCTSEKVHKSKYSGKYEIFMTLNNLIKR